MTDQEARDEREALVDAMINFEVPEVTDDYEAGYAEGFHHGRSTPAPREVTDEMIERFKSAWFDYPIDRGMGVFERRARAALEAALNPKEEA